MRRRRAAAFAWFLPVIISGGWSLAVPAPSPVLASPLAPPISGVVSHLENPIGGVLVILYNLGDTSLTRSRTAPDGTFVLASAPVGVYDLIAYKSGFLPALVRLWHQPASAGVSAVRIQLAARSESARDRKEASSVWDLRDKLPAEGVAESSVLPAMSAVEEDVLSALINLGYQRAAAERALASVAKNGQGSSFEVMFRQTLAVLSK